MPAMISVVVSTVMSTVVTIMVSAVMAATGIEQQCAAYVQTVPA